MAWIKVHSEFLDSWKVAEVCESLNICEAQAIGHVVSLWCFTEKNAWQDGDLTRWKVAGVAKAARWQGKPAVFVEALQKSTLLDSGTLIVHDWTKHQARMIHDRGNMRQYQGASGGNVGGKWGEVGGESGGDLGGKWGKRGENPLPDKRREVKRREEKRREEGEGSARPRGNSFKKPNIDNIKEYAASIGHASFPSKKFMSHYEANGWMVGKVPMRDWQAAVRSWLEGSTPAGSAPAPGNHKSSDPRIDEIMERKRQQALEEQAAAKEADRAAGKGEE